MFTRIYMLFFDISVTVSVKFFGNWVTTHNTILVLLPLEKMCHIRKGFRWDFFMCSMLSSMVPLSGEVLFNPWRGSGLGGQGAREDNGPLPQLGQPLFSKHFLSRTRYSLEACVRGIKRSRRKISVWEVVKIVSLWQQLTEAGRGGGVLLCTCAIGAVY
jgi:hypothetical protein